MLNFSRKISVILLFLAFACQSEFKYEPLKTLEGNNYSLLEVKLKDLDNGILEEVRINESSKIFFSNCNSQTDKPCMGKLKIENEKINFTYGISYPNKVLIQGLDTTIKNIPNDLPIVILTGDYSLKKLSKNTFLLKGVAGLKKNYPKILATHEISIVMKKE